MKFVFYRSAVVVQCFGKFAVSIIINIVFTMKHLSLTLWHKNCQIMTDLGQYTQNPLPPLSNMDQPASYNSVTPMDSYSNRRLPSPPRHSSPGRVHSPRGRSPPRTVSYRHDDSYSRSRDRSRSPPPRWAAVLLLYFLSKAYTHHSNNYNCSYEL